MMKVLLTMAFLFLLLALATAQVDEQHPYRQITLRTKVNVESSRERDARYRYSRAGDLYSSDRRYTQKVRLRITVTNLSQGPLEDIRVQYRIYKRSLNDDRYSVAVGGEIAVPPIEANELSTLFTDEAVCEYRLRWDKLVRGNRLSRSGEKYAGYVVIYSDTKGPVRWDMSSRTIYAEYARELRLSQKASPSSTMAPVSSGSEKLGSLPYSAEMTVYVTRTGRKFHRKDCGSLRSGSRAILREEALKSGYTPCALCKP